MRRSSLRRSWNNSKTNHLHPAARTRRRPWFPKIPMPPLCIEIPPLVEILLHPGQILRRHPLLRLKQQVDLTFCRISATPVRRPFNFPLPMKAWNSDPFKNIIFTLSSKLECTFVVCPMTDMPRIKKCEYRQLVVEDQPHGKFFD